jgi:hypothetical protein
VLGDPQIKGAWPEPSKMMMVFTIVSVVIIIVVVWRGHVAAREVDVTLKAYSAPGTNEETFFCTLEATEVETAPFIDIIR